jgi:Cu+-exporting ATPase
MSEHPISLAIKKIANNSSQNDDISSFKAMSGSGVYAKINGKDAYGVNLKTAVEITNVTAEQIALGERLSEEGKTPLYFIYDGALYGIISVADTLRSTAVDAISELRSMGIKTLLLTGDNRRVAEAIGSAAGVDDIISDVLPDDKEEVVRGLMSDSKVMMVGDGINDAPALVTADVGMAIGAGTDIAMESADVVLMSGSLTGIANAIRLSKATMRNIRQNLFWAFFYNCLGIPLAAAGMLSPMIGAAAMSFSSVFVVTNALRLRRFKADMIPVKENIKEEKIMTTVINVNGMMCPHCKAMVEKVCKAVSGTEDAVVDLQAKTVTVTGAASLDLLKKAITDAGYEVVE